MNDIFHVDRSLPIPLYQQLVDSIRAAIKTGQLTDGQQLPTVQELDLSRGTIIRAYSTLEQEGLLEMVQGRGTFVRCVPVSERSRKEQAMAAIDTLLDTLEGMGFSATEINIFLSLKLRERSEQDSKVKIALVECNPENLSHMSRQLRSIPNVEIYSYLMSSIVQYPYNLKEDMDLILTTPSHKEELAQLLPMKKRVTTVALRLCQKFMVSIVKLDPGTRVGILCQSETFGGLLEKACRAYADHTRISAPLVLGQGTDTADYLVGKQVLVVPEELEHHCSAETLQLLQNFPGQIIRGAYELDEGSMLYLQEKCGRIIRSKKL